MLADKLISYAKCNLGCNCDWHAANLLCHLAIFRFGALIMLLCMLFVCFCLWVLLPSETAKVSFNFLLLRHNRHDFHVKGCNPHSEDILSVSVGN